MKTLSEIKARPIPGSGPGGKTYSMQRGKGSGAKQALDEIVRIVNHTREGYWEEDLLTIKKIAETAGRGLK